MAVEHLAQVVPPTGEPPADIGTGHPMRELTELLASDPGAWTPERASLVAGFFEEIAPVWSSREGRTEVLEALHDALDRGRATAEPVVEIGAGTGAGTRILAERFDHVIAGDLSAGMLERLPSSLASRVRLDGSALPFADGTVGTLVCVNMLLFAGEVRRVLAPGGSLVWVSSIGECTPIYLSAERVAEALGADFTVTASRAGWGTWAVARHTG